MHKAKDKAESEVWTAKKSKSDISNFKLCIYVDQAWNKISVSALRLHIKWWRKNIFVDILLLHCDSCLQTSISLPFWEDSEWK